jgi:hypothetical protein
MRSTLILVLGLTSCWTPNNSKESLQDSLLEYARGVKWSRPEIYKPFLPRTAAVTFDPALAPATLQVTDCEVSDVNVAADKGQARVTMRVEWYLADQMRVYSSLLLQSWRLVDKSRWEIFEQKTVQGAPFPPPRPAPIIRGTAFSAR